MARTTIDLDDPLLRELKRLQKRKGITLGQLISTLLTKALAHEGKDAPAARPFKWTSQQMGTPRVDFRDKDALWSLLDVDAGPSKRGS